MFYTLKINAFRDEKRINASEAITIQFNKTPQHGKMHFIALDHQMASNIYRRKTGLQVDIYQVEVTCYDSNENVAYLNSREVKPAKFM